MRSMFSFPNPVNEKAARTVATGVVLMGIAFVITGSRWILIPLVFGFIARVASGPRFSPLGQLATRVIAPRLGDARLVAGPPKRFAQGIGAAFSITAAILFLSVGPAPARVVIALLVVAASLEAFAGLCLGCQAFAALMRVGVIPESVCAECADLSLRHRVAAERSYD